MNRSGRKASRARAGVVGMPDPEDLDAAAVEVAKIEQAFDQRRLARAIDADQAEAHPCGDVEVYPLQHCLLAVVLADLVETDSRLRHWMR